MKKLLLSTAIVAATSMPVFAQESEGMFRQEVNAQELHASDFIGMRVYRSDEVDAEEYEGVQEGWDDIGEINDVVFSRDGQVEAVLVDIGGFLGMGENQVAVDMDSLRFVSDSATADQENDFFLVLDAPRDALEGAPTYSRALGDAEGEDMQSADTTESAEGEEQLTEADDATATDGTETAAGDAATEETDMAAEGDMATDDTEMAAEGDVTTEETDMTAEGDMTTDETDLAAEGDATTDPAATDTQMSDGTGFSREGYVTADNSQLTADDLTGATTYDANDERVGDVSDLLLAEDGKVEAAIVDIGGFLGIGAKSVALELSKLDILRSEDGSDLRVYVTMTEEELEALPEFEN